MCNDARGVLYPNELPDFQRRAAPADLRHLVRWFWVPRWNISSGKELVQKVLPFPAANLVVEPSGTVLVGATTGASTRTLRGSGWAVGALLRPAAFGELHAEPARLRDNEEKFDAHDLQATINEAMPDDIDAAIRAYEQWLRGRIRSISEAGVLANTMEDLIAEDREITRVQQVANKLLISMRGVQRLVQRFVGVPPLVMIRRYRLQEAALQIREQPDLSLSELASKLGYADQAHLHADFRTVLGQTPLSYRRQVN